MTALNEPVRARLLRVIERHELNVGEISQILQLPQSTASRHIKVLSDSAWLTSRREGTSRLYRLASDTFSPSQARLWTLLRDGLSQEALVEQDDSRLQRVLFERQSKGQQFFASSAGRWDRLRSELFGQEFELRLLPALLPEGSIVCDLGCGTGRISELLAPFAQRVIAVDASEAMIAAARARLEHQSQSIDNIELHHAQLERLPLEAASADLALMVLVLHYVSDPQVVLQETARILKPGGKLVVLDMLPHSREEYRAQMGHLWPGFERKQLGMWLKAAGLEFTSYLTLPPDPSARGPALFLGSAQTETMSGAEKRYLLLGSNC